MGKKQVKKDFDRNKLKLGTARGLKKKSVTHTNLSFKSRGMNLFNFSFIILNIIIIVLNMPEQSILKEKGEEVTHRKLDLNSLFHQLKHYSDNVKRGICPHKIFF